MLRQSLVGTLEVAAQFSVGSKEEGSLSSSAASQQIECLLEGCEVILVDLESTPDMYYPRPANQQQQQQTLPARWWVNAYCFLHRRLELYVVGTLNFFVGIPICLIVAGLLIYFSFWARTLMLLYLAYSFTIGKVTKYPVARRSFFCQNIAWRYYRDYFPIRMCVSEEAKKAFDPSRNYIFGYHPHAVHAFGAFCAFGGDGCGFEGHLPGIKPHLQTLRINFFIPFWRELKGLGLGDASSRCLQKTLTSGPGESVLLVVGGAQESLLSRPHTNHLVLHKRKGFVRIALQSGASIVPVFAFGETSNFTTRSAATDSQTFVWRMAMKLKKIFGFTIPMIKGRGLMGMVPLRKPVHIVIGTPIHLPRVEIPSAELIDEFHGKYVAGLRGLYDEYCGVYDLGSEGLNIVA